MRITELMFNFDFTTLHSISSLLLSPVSLPKQSLSKWNSGGIWPPCLHSQVCSKASTPSQTRNWKKLVDSRPHTTAEPINWHTQTLGYWRKTPSRPHPPRKDARPRRLPESAERCSKGTKNGIDSTLQWLQTTPTPFGNRGVPCMPKTLLNLQLQKSSVSALRKMQNRTIRQKWKKSTWNLLRNIKIWMTLTRKIAIVMVTHLALTMFLMPWWHKCHDDISAEHFLNAPYNLFLILCALFNAMLRHSFVPRQFKHGTIVPIVKDHQGNLGDVGNYRGITISPIASTIFEHCLKIVFHKYLTTNALEFGFKSKSSTSHALYCLKESVNYYIRNGSRVFCTYLDASKAFDRLIHAGLFLKLLKRGVLKTFLDNHILVYRTRLSSEMGWQSQSMVLSKGRS